MTHTQDNSSNHGGFARAWIDLFDDYREGRSVLLGRQRLDHALRYKLRTLEQAQADAALTSRVRTSHALLSACLGEADLVMVGRVEDELPRPRAERLAPAGEIAALLEAKRARAAGSADTALPGTRPLPMSADVRLRPEVSRPTIPPPAARPSTAARPSVAARPSAPASAPLQARPSATPSQPPPRASWSSEPRTPQMLGRYLLASGRITLSELTDAILWQRAQRPAVGRIAQEWRILTQEQVVQVLRDKPYNEFFCDYAVRVGLMTAFHRTAIIAKQRKMQRQIGEYFVERGLLSRDEVDEYARLARVG